MMSASSAPPRHLGGNTWNTPGLHSEMPPLWESFAIVASLHREIKRVTRSLFSGLCYENNRGRLNLSLICWLQGFVRIFGFCFLVLLTCTALQLAEKACSYGTSSHQNCHTPGQQTTRYLETGRHLVRLSRVLEGSKSTGCHSIS